MSTTAVHSEKIKRSRGGTQPLPLTRADIVDAALPLLADLGVEGLTVKAVADALGITSPAVYHYVHGRDDLIDRLCERVAAEVNRNVAVLLGADVAWDDGVVAVLMEMDRTFARYPGVAARVLPTHRRSRAEAESTDTVRRLLSEGGFDDERADEVLAALQYLFGGWLLRPHATDRAVLQQSIRWLLRGAK
jgi:TetR/AcrR family transcriptional regulator, tetracycline repressor protein